MTEDKNYPGVLAEIKKPFEDLPKLNFYDSQYANAKVAMAPFWKHLEALDAVANDPDKVKAWGENLWSELAKCQVCIS